MAFTGKIYAACWTTDELHHDIRNCLCTRGCKNLRGLRRDITKLAVDNCTDKPVFVFIWVFERHQDIYYIDKFKITPSIL